MDNYNTRAVQPPKTRIQNRKNHYLGYNLQSDMPEKGHGKIEESTKEEELQNGNIKISAMKKNREGVGLPHQREGGPEEVEKQGYWKENHA